MDHDIMMDYGRILVWFKYDMVARIPFFSTAQVFQTRAERAPRASRRRGAARRERGRPSQGAGLHIGEVYFH